VVTPGQNQKRYLAVALDVGTGQVVWVEGQRKHSALVITLLNQLARRHPSARVIHVILDNDRIANRKITQAALGSYGGRIRLHFLPPYCSNDNQMDRIWQDLNTEVTRNHPCVRMNELPGNVHDYLWQGNETVNQTQRRQAG
jgi:transposase